MSRALPGVVIALIASVGCSSNRNKYSMTDVELRLTAQQARGRQVYNASCLQCHESYTDSRRNSFALRGVFKKPYLPSGLPANDARVGEVIAQGKRMMPATSLTGDDLQALLAYLHTL